MLSPIYAFSRALELEGKQRTVVHCRARCTVICGVLALIGNCDLENITLATSLDYFTQ